MERCEELLRTLSPFFDGLQNMEMKLKCPVCNNLLEEPKLLPCDHIICRKCLPIVDGKQPSCPICKKFRPKDARASLYVEEMIKIFNEMDGAISDIFKQITSGKASICEETETKAKSPAHKERSHVSVTSSSCKEDEVIILGSVRSIVCNEEETNTKGTTKSKNCALDISPTSSSCEIIETNTVVSTARGLSNKEAETSRGSKNPSAVAAKGAKRWREEKNTIGSDQESKRHNLGDCLKFETNQLEIKPRSTPINLFDDECAFCHSFRATELYGPIVCYLSGILVELEEADQENVIHVHEKCLAWAPNIYYSGDKVMNLEEEIERGAELICSKCGVEGAVLGCFYGPCRRSYHATCALEIDCSWDSENFKMLCPAHAFEKLDKFIPDETKMEP